MLEVWNLFLNPYQYDIVNYVKVTIFKNVFFFNSDLCISCV